jgi:hypothetical protein
VNAVKYLEMRHKKESLRAIARDLGVSHPYLVDLMKGRRNAGPKLLGAIQSKKDRNA